MEPFIGQIIMFGGSYAPRNWAFCDGQLVAISSNQALFSILGTTYGGNGRTTFALPDLKGRVPIGPGAGEGLPPYRPGIKGGQPTHTLTSIEMPSHTHVVVPGGSGSAVKLSTDTAVNEVPVAGDVPAVGNYAAGAVAKPVKSFGPNANTVDGQSITSTSTNAPTGGSRTHNNMQPYLPVYYIIALQGLFPSRS